MSPRKSIGRRIEHVALGAVVAPCLAVVILVAWLWGRLLAGITALEWLGQNFEDYTRDSDARSAVERG